MKKCGILLNHELTSEQKKELHDRNEVNKLIDLPDELAFIWANVDPEHSIRKDQLDKIETWLKRTFQPGDYLIIQGEFGLTYYFVDFAFKVGLIPLYAATTRVAKETVPQDGSVEKISVFTHIRFKQYRRSDDI
ncbi:hypothetical protein JXO52_03790 [bacterium]|nr:hypothetical protein [bacterium]